MRRPDEGSAIVEFVWLAILLLVPLVYVVITVFETQRTAYAVSAAARSAGRAFVTAPDQTSAYARARSAARLAFDDQGTDAPVRVSISCRPSPRACLSPGSVIFVRVDSAVVLPLLPAVFGGHSPQIAVDASHQEPYGTFREARP